jgi:hypothetical protein
VAQEADRLGVAAALGAKALYPEREIGAVTDRAYASLKLLDHCRKLREKPITFITRLSLDAALYQPAAVRRPGQRGRPGLKGERLPNLSVVAEDPSTVCHCGPKQAARLGRACGRYGH